MYLRVTTEMLKKQIAETCVEYVFHSLSKNQTFTHTVTAEIGSKSRPAVERYTKSSKVLSVL